MRIGLVTGEYPPMEGGVGAFTHELALALRDLDQDICILTRKLSDPTPVPGITIVTVCERKWDWSTGGHVRALVVSQGLDIVNIQFQTAAYDMHPAIQWTPGLITSSGIPCITTFHDLRAPYLFPKAGPIRAWTVKRLARSSSGVIATDHADEEQLKSDWGVHRVRWIPIGSNVKPLDSARVDRRQIRSELGVGREQLLISYFGFLNETKGALTLVEALSQLVAQGIDAQVVMIGGRAGASDPTNRDYGKRVDEAVKRLGLSERIRWSGFVDDVAVSEYFFASDLTALPYADGASLRRGTLMAALAHGRAIVTTRPVSPELDGVVQAVPPGDPVALAGMIAEVWRDSQARSALERAALKASHQFGWAGIAHSTFDYFCEFVPS